VVVSVTWCRTRVCAVPRGVGLGYVQYGSRGYVCGDTFERGDVISTMKNTIAAEERQLSKQWLLQPSRQVVE